MHFPKGYKQFFTDEVFEKFNLSSRNPPTSKLIDADKEPIEGNFCEPELIRLLEKKGSHLTMSSNTEEDNHSFTITLVSSA